MKKYLWILCALLFATLAVACSDDDEAPSNVSVVTLSDTQITLETERNGGFTPDTQEGYPVGYYTRQFAQAVPAPANSSGWFIPAVSQLCTVYGLREQLDAREGMTRLRNRWYWSSSECYALADGSINCLDVSTGMVGYRGKYDAIGLIRPILAF